MTTYRLLNKGEEIQEGDECCYRSEEWTKVKHRAHVTNPLFNSYIFRRPISTGWIKLSELKPTEADANKRGWILLRNLCGGIWPAHLDYYHKSDATHFLPLPKFQETDEDEDYKSFDKWAAGRSAIHEAGDLRNLARKAWDAALEHARKKQ